MLLYSFWQKTWTWRTDGRTDRQTDTARRHRPRLRIASRGNKTPLKLESLLCRGVYSDTTQLTQSNSVQPSQPCFCYDVMTYKLRWQLFRLWTCRTSSWVELSCVAINTPLSDSGHVQSRCWNAPSDLLHDLSVYYRNQRNFVQVFVHSIVTVRSFSALPMPKFAIWYLPYSV